MIDGMKTHIHCTLSTYHCLDQLKKPHHCDIGKLIHFVLQLLQSIWYKQSQKQKKWWSHLHHLLILNDSNLMLGHNWNLNYDFHTSVNIKMPHMHDKPVKS